MLNAPPRLPRLKRLRALGDWLNWLRDYAEGIAPAHSQTVRLSRTSAGHSFHTDPQDSEPSEPPVKQFILKDLFDIHGDYTVCYSYAIDQDGNETIGTDPVPIARDWLLRKSPFDEDSPDKVDVMIDGEAITYRYVSNTVRIAQRRGKTDETQTIVPHYFKGCILYAAEVQDDLGLIHLIPPPPGSTDIAPFERVSHVELSSRAWAQVPAAASPPPPPPPPPLPEGTTEAFSALDPEDSASLYKLYFLMGDLSVLCPQNGLFYIWTLQRLDDEEAGPLTGRWIETTTPPITRLHVAGDDGNFYEWIPELVDGVVTSSGRWLQTDCTCDLLTNVVQQTTDGKIYQWTPETLDGGGVGGRWKLIA